MRSDPSLITISLAVDYWDYLGWKDTLALHGHSTRERAYADARGDREVYTPQVVVNGVVHVVGSDKARDRAAPSSRRGMMPRRWQLPVTMTVADGKVTVNVPASAKDRSKAPKSGCARSTRKAPSRSNRGENRGHTLAYYNVVRRWVKLGNWSGKAETFTVPLAEPAGCGFFVARISTD